MIPIYVNLEQLYRYCSELLQNAFLRDISYRITCTVVYMQSYATFKKLIQKKFAVDEVLKIFNRETSTDIQYVNVLFLRVLGNCLGT